VNTLRPASPPPVSPAQAPVQLMSPPEPRMPMVAVAVLKPTLRLLALAIRPVSARTEPRNSDTRKRPSPAFFSSKTKLSTRNFVPEPSDMRLVAKHEHGTGAGAGFHRVTRIDAAAIDQAAALARAVHGVDVTLGRHHLGAGQHGIGTRVRRATLADSAPQSLAHTRASKSVPRMPMVAVLVCTRAAFGEVLEIRPVTARKPPRTSCMSMLLSGAFSLNWYC
jgi:hypothetical protein